MMDLQKEREEFEDWFESQFESTNLHKFDDGVYWHERAQMSWEAWQAAKAQAVPDGYKVVPVNYECVWCGCTELDGWTDETMIEAQEQEHE